MAGPVKTLDVVPGASERPVIDGSAVDIEDGGEHFSGDTGQRARGRSGSVDAASVIRRPQGDAGRGPAIYGGRFFEGRERGRTFDNDADGDVAICTAPGRLLAVALFASPAQGTQFPLSM
jgi:hypothetical protein